MAKAVIKRYVRAFGAGVEKVFWYTFVGTPTPEETDYGSGAKTLGLGWDFPKKLGLARTFHPRQAYYTYKLMTSKLKGFESVEKILDTQYKFTFRNRNPVYVLWCSEGKCALPQEITGAVKVTDYQGKEQLKDASGIILSEDPIFVE